MRVDVGGECWQYAFSSGFMSTWGDYFGILCAAADVIKTVSESVESGETFGTTFLKAGASFLESYMSI